MAGEAGLPRTVLMATQEAFAAETVTRIEAAFAAAGNYTLVRLENYKSKDEFLAASAVADAMIIRSDIVDEAVLGAAGKLKLVVRAGCGTDNIDLRSCEAKGVTAMNTPGQNSNAIAELVFGMMLVSARGNFDGSSGFEISGREIAFYGFGAVARAVHKLCKGFGMRTFAYDPFIPAEAIAEAGATPVATVADLFEHQYVTLHVPCTPETKGSINRDLLMRMPLGGRLVNTAQAELVQEAELLEVLQVRPDFCYLSDVAPENIEEVKALVGDEYGKRVIFSKQNTGKAPTLEAISNSGVAAAKQIVGFFEQGVTRFSKKAPRPPPVT